MTPSRLSSVGLALVLVLTVGPARAQSTLFDLEVGFQSVDISGNEDMFRSQVDEDDGLVLRSLSVSFVEPLEGEALVDRLRVDAAGFGGEPDGRFFFEASRATSYRLQLTYRHMNAFSALPAFANPVLEEGITPGQHTSDRQRDLFDFELEILPGRTITPLIGYRRNDYDGPGRTTYHVGQDEFLLVQDLDQREQEYRVGLAVHGGNFKGSLVQGWRDFEGDQRLTLAPGAVDGNNPGELLGREISLDSYTRTEESRIDGSVTRGYVTGRVGERFRVVGEYVRSDWDSDTFDEDEGSGSLASFELSRFFSEFTESVESSADSPAWRGEARLEAELNGKFYLDTGYATSHREVDGSALITSLFFDTMNFVGADQDDIQRILDVRSAFERDVDRFEIRLTGRELGRFRAWAGYALTSEDVAVEPDVAEIVVPGGQGGVFDRDIDAFEAGTAFVTGGFTVSVDWRTEDADRSIVRTDFLERERLRGRVTWERGDLLRVTGTLEDSDADNPTSGIDYTQEILHWMLDLDLAPTDDLTLRFAYDSYERDSQATFLRPETLEPALSVYEEDGEVLDFGILWRRGRFDIDASYARLDNAGDRDLELDHGFLRLGYDVTERFGAALELETWDYSEELLPLADFDAERYGLFVRWRG